MHVAGEFGQRGPASKLLNQQGFRSTEAEDPLLAVMGDVEG